MQMGKKVDNGYWEIRGDRLVNQGGGWHPYYPSPDDEIIEVESYHDLDWSYLLNPESLYGWLSPEGEYYGCDYMQHAMIADLILDKDEIDMEEEGYVKIFCGWDCERDFFVNKQLTRKQRDWFLLNALELLKPWDRED